MRNHGNRTFLQSHPWINFGLNLEKVNHLLWMLLGEARSKCEHIAGVPLRADTAKKLYDIYLAKGVHATTSIEGNTLSEDEVAERLKKPPKLPRSRAYLGQEVDNIIKACNQISDEILSTSDWKLTPDRVLAFNKLVLEGLEVDTDTVPGQFRRHSVGVGRYRGAPAEDCPYLVEQLCEWLNGPDFRSDNPEIAFALILIKAVVAHLYIAWIHPFGDGNGRTARLIEFQLLVESGMVPLPSGNLLSNHYNKTRSQYYRELDRSSKVDGGVLSFLEYAVPGFVDELREQIGVIRDQQWQVAWESYVHQILGTHETAAMRRQRHLVLDLPSKKAIPRGEIPMVSPRVAAEYAGRGEKTVSRDLNALIGMKLVRKTRTGYVANREVILAFLPPRREEGEFVLDRE